MESALLGSCQLDAKRQKLLCKLLSEEFSICCSTAREHTNASPKVSHLFQSEQTQSGRITVIVG